MALILYSNTMIYSGLFITDFRKGSTLILPENNTLNEKRILLIRDKTTLDSINLSDYAQIICINCSGFELEKFGLSNVSCAFQFIDCIDLTLADSEFEDCYQTIYSSDSETKISGCKITNSTDGILADDSEYIVYSCILRDLKGTGFWGGGWSRSAIIRDSLFINCSKGIDLYHGRDSVITENLFLGCRGPGIELNDSRSVSIYHNCFINNGGSNGSFNVSRPQAISIHSRCVWNTPEGQGNYWMDWTGPDNNSDGIVDIPLQIIDDERDDYDAYDFYPLTDPGKVYSRPPTSFEGVQGRDWINLSWEDPISVMDIPPGDIIVFRYFEGNGLSRYRTIPSGIGFFNDTGLDHRIDYSYYLVGRNSYGESDPTKTLVFELDGDPPQVRINEPEEGAIYDLPQLEMKWYVSDDPSGIGRIALYLNGGPGIPLKIWQDLTINAINGSNTVRLVASDIYGNLGEDIVNFSVDTHFGSLEIRWPEGNLTNRTWIEALVIAQDAYGVDEISFRIDDGDWAVMREGNRIQLANLSDGVHLLQARARDKVGHWGYAESEFVVDTIEPSLSIISPADDQLFNTTEVVLNWTCSDLTSGVSKIELTLNGQIMEDHRIGSMALILIEGQNVISIMVADKALNMNRTYLRVLVDTKPPSLSSYTPKGDGVAVNSSIGFKVSEVLPAGGVYVKIAGVTGKLTHDGTDYKFDPDKDLAYGTIYQVRIGAKDRAGNVMEFSWEFTTSSEPPMGNHPQARSGSLPWWIAIMIVLALIALGAILFLWSRNHRRDIWEE